MNQSEETILATVTDGKEILDALGITPEVFARVAVNSLLANPMIAECDPPELKRAVMNSIELGLLPDGRQAAILPFKKKGGGVGATLVPMIEGRILLARRACPGIVLRVRAVFREDIWSYSDGLIPAIKHEPNPEASRTDDDLIAVYAIAHQPKAPAPEFEVMFSGDITRYRAKSRAGSKGKGPWATDYIEMAKKTVMGQLLKRLPKVAGEPPDDGFADEAEAWHQFDETEQPMLEASTGDDPEPEPQPQARQTPPPATSRKVKNQPPDFADAPF